MKTYLVLYESIFSEDASLINSIKSFERWAYPIKGAWLVKTYFDRQTVYDRLKNSSAFVSKLIVIRVTNDWISYNLTPDVIRWMQEGLE